MYYYCCHVRVSELMVCCHLISVIQVDTFYLYSALSPPPPPSLSLSLSLSLLSPLYFFFLILLFFQIQGETVQVAASW